MKKNLIVVLCCAGTYTMGLLDTLDKLLTWQFLIAAAFMAVAYLVVGEP